MDTNIFVYAKLINAQEQAKYQQAKAFFQSQQLSVVISAQVLNEFANVLIKHRVADIDIQLVIDAIAENSLVAPVSFHTVQDALRIKSRWQFSYRDSLIIASALENGCTILFTEDLQHNQVIDG
ncbi:MAG: PIN domain-containing protein [Methylovulum sp.]|nr:PIN domain-containing protein [Methylovulum sp.]MCF7997463.1 PIN domain-containing protein [Methylovulum sp.]